MNDGGENGNEFVGFLVRGFDRWGVQLTIFSEVFDPELALVGLLKELIEFGTKFTVGAGAGCFTDVRGD